MTKSKLFILTIVAVFLVGSLAFAAEKEFANQFEKDEMWVEENLSSYNQAPELAKLVETGKLAPVEDRLPDVPRVVKSNIMADGIGVYGGVWRDTFAVPVASWNWGAQKTQGWFGINQMVQESLVVLGPMWMLEEPNPLPNLATDWEWSEDGKSLTMNLMKGAKWSDGAPFTADDVLFTYNDLILNPNIPTWGSSSRWVFGDKQTELEKIDEDTVVWRFGEAFPVSVFANMGYLQFSVSPKHVYKNFHPDYNTDATYDDFINATPPDDLPAVVMGPWVPVEYAPGQQLVMVRNPYYWQVDEQGNQLPYIDEVVFNEVQSGEIRTMNLISGKADRTNLENPQTFSLVRQATQGEDAPAVVKFGPFGIGYRIMMNLSKYKNINDDRDAELRELFRIKEFRQALSHAIDRQAIANVAFPGPLTQPWYGGYPSGSGYYNEDRVVKYKYDLAATKGLLKDLGFEDTNGDGILNWSKKSKIAGEELVIEMLIAQDQAAAVDAGEALVSMFREAGIKLVIRPSVGQTLTTLTEAGDFEMYFTRLDSAQPFWQMDQFGPVDDRTPIWHTAAAGGERDLLPFEEKIKEKMLKSRFITDATKRKALFEDILELSTRNIYQLGVYEVRRGTGLHKRIRNFQPDIPPYMYNWTVNSIPVQILYVEEEDQFETNFQDLIPIEADYNLRSWNK